MQDEIDLSSVAILNAPAVRDWAVTADLSSVEVSPENLRFAFSKKDGPDRWPDQPFGVEGGSLQYTVWLFLNVAGTWFASAFVQMWFGRDGTGDGISDFPKNWYYDAGRWGPMVGHVVQPGETIGFMVTAGDARNGASSSVHERSNIITIEAPPEDGAPRLFGGDPPSVPPVTVTPPIIPQPAGDELAAIIDELKLAIDTVRDGLAAVVVRLDRLHDEGIKVHL